MAKSAPELACVPLRGETEVGEQRTRRPRLGDVKGLAAKPEGDKLSSPI